MHVMKNLIIILFVIGAIAVIPGLIAYQSARSETELAAPSKKPKDKIERRIEPQIDNIEGYYKMKGKEQSEPPREYTGIVLLRKRADVYVVSWLTNEGSPSTGIGIRVGDTFATSSIITGSTGQPIKCVTIYKITPNALTGTWATVPGSGQLGTEELRFLSKLE